MFLVSNNISLVYVYHFIYYLWLKEIWLLHHFFNPFVVAFKVFQIDILLRLSGRNVLLCCT